MKSFSYVSTFTLISVAVALGSCSSVAPVSAKAPAPPAKVAKQRTIVTKVPVLVKETSYYPDGLVDEYISYKLDQAEKVLVEKSTYDPSRPDPVERLVPEYADAPCRRIRL